MDSASADFLARVFAGGLEKYRERIRQYGLSGRQHVLDAGCGFGQWTLALAAENTRVDAVDINASRLQFLTDVAGDGNIGNINTQRSSLDALPYSGALFDGVFCYQALPAVPWREAISEFARVLKPGGVFYGNANGFGYFKYLWYQEPGKIGDYAPRRCVAEGLLNTWRYDCGEATEGLIHNLIEPSDLDRELCQNGFEDIRFGAEGTLCRDDYDGPDSAPFFKDTYEGELGVYEVLAVKS